MLGSSRKYVSLLNGTESGPILSFAYFVDPIEEAGKADTPASYWGFLKYEERKLEARWAEEIAIADANTASPAQQK